MESVGVIGFVPRSMTIVVARELNGLEVAWVLDEAEASFVSEIVGLVFDNSLLPKVLSHTHTRVCVGILLPSQSRRNK
jgi:hypothetical protein